MQQIKERLEQIPINVPGPSGDSSNFESSNPRFQNIWNFYKKELLDENANPQAANGGSYTILPMITQNTQNLKIIKEIGDLAEEFVVNVRIATR